MKIAGKKVDTSPNVELIVIPRTNRDPIVFKVQAVIEYKEFEELVPRPTPRKSLKPGGDTVDNLDDANYLAELNMFAKKQTYYMFVKSIFLGTPDIEFDLIKLTDPDSWLKFEEEFRSAGFTVGEINYVINKIMDVNTLNESKIEAARASFTLSQVEPKVGQ